MEKEIANKPNKPNKPNESNKPEANKTAEDSKRKPTATHRYVTDIYGHTYALPHSVNLTHAKSVSIHPTAQIIIADDPEPSTSNPSTSTSNPSTSNPSTSKSKTKNPPAKKPGIVNFFGECVLGPDTIIRVTPNNCITISNCRLNSIYIELSAPSESYLTLDNVTVADLSTQTVTAQRLPTSQHHQLIFDETTDCPAPNRFNAKLENLKLCYHCTFRNIHWIQGLPPAKLKVKKTTAKPKTHPKTNRALTRNQTKLPTIELVEKKLPTAPLELFNCHFSGPITLRTQNRLQNIRLQMIPANIFPGERLTPLHLTFNHDQLKANNVDTTNPDSLASALHQKHLTPDPKAEISKADLEQIKQERSKERTAREQAEKEISEQPFQRRFGHTQNTGNPAEPNKLAPASLPTSVLDEVSSLLGKK